MLRLFVLVSVLTIGACGAGAHSTFQDDSDRYVGTWQITSGTDTSNCVGEAPTAITGSVIIDVGATPGALSVRDTNHGSCIWTLRASAARATFLSGEECAATAGLNAAAVTPRDYTFVLVSNQEAMVTSKFDWTILGDTCTHDDEEALLAMTVSSQGN